MLILQRLKCDRNQPCSSCSNRGLSNSCTYVPLATNGARKMDQVKRSPQSGSSVQDRINQLEALVLTLMHSTHQKPPQSASGASKNANELDAELSDSFGRISLENDETRYVSGDHWISILEGVRYASLFSPYSTNDPIRLPSSKTISKMAIRDPAPSLQADLMSMKTGARSFFLDATTRPAGSPSLMPCLRDPWLIGSCPSISISWT